MPVDHVRFSSAEITGINGDPDVLDGELLVVYRPVTDDKAEGMYLVYQPDESPVAGSEVHDLVANTMRHAMPVVAVLRKEEMDALVEGGRAAFGGSGA